MAVFSFAEGSAMFDSTPIENMFLLEYLSSAPESCLRAYLYARMLALHPELGGDMTETARFLRMDEEAVYKAFEYWERQGLARRLSDRPPTYELIPLRSDGAGGGGTMDSAYYAYRDFSASLQELFGQQIMEPHDFRVASDWMDVLGYDQDAVLRLVRYGIETSRSKQPVPRGVFKRMDRLAAAWADEGCRTAEDVEQAITRQRAGYAIAKAVVKRFSLRREPTEDELNLAKKWTCDWRLSEAQVLDACQETTKSSAPTFAYLDAILKSRLDGSGEYWKPLSDALRELDPYAKPTPELMSRYAALRAEGFEEETVRLAAAQCRRRNRTRFEELEWMLKKWAEKGVYTPDAARDYIDRMQRQTERVRALLELSGSDRRPTMADIEMAEGWRANHDDAVIEYAATCARGMQMPIKYMDRLLSAWRDEGVGTVDEARARHEAARTARAPSAASERKNPALDYAQREYRDEDFGDGFFINLDANGEEGDGK